MGKKSRLKKERREQKQFEVFPVVMREGLPHLPFALEMWEDFKKDIAQTEGDVYALIHNKRSILTGNTTETAFEAAVFGTMVEAVAALEPCTVDLIQQKRSTELKAQKLQRIDPADLTSKETKQLLKTAELWGSISAKTAELEKNERFEHLRNLNLEPFGDEKTQLIREILRLARTIIIREHDANTPLHERSCFLHPEIYPRIREIGERLWEITKDDDPEYIQWFFDCDLLSVPRQFHREIEFAWNGIGWVRA